MCVHVFTSVCVHVCVCVCERERELRMSGTGLLLLARYQSFNWLKFFLYVYQDIYFNILVADFICESFISCIINSVIYV